MGAVLKVRLSERRPVEIDRDKWPRLAWAEGDDYRGTDPQRGRQARARGECAQWWIAVRTHLDGRTLVYGVYQDDWHRQRGDAAAGVLLEQLPNDTELLKVVRSVAAELGIPNARAFAREVIQDLPPELV